jgi:phage anti-repressor protein
MFKKLIEKSKFKKNLKKVRILNEPLQENNLSIIYSITKGELDFLLIENSKNNILWPNTKQLGFMNEINTKDPVRELYINLNKNIFPSMAHKEFKKYIMNIHTFDDIKFDVNPEILNIHAKVFLVELDDYILRSCRGKKNDLISDMDYISFIDLSRNLLMNSKFENSLQPHFKYLFIEKEIHKRLMNRFGKKRDIFDIEI